MKKFLVLFLVITSFWSAAQSNGNIDSKIVFNDGTILNTKVKFRVNMFWSDLIDEASITGKKIAVIDNDKVTKLLASDIESIEFTDLKNNQRTFKRLPDYKTLVEILYNGKILWYRVYYTNMYDGSTQQSDFMKKGNDKEIALGMFSNRRKKLKSLMSDRAELEPMIEKINYDKLKEEEVIELLKKYDE